jgi:8-hydroxy-5-deazaflavin:NADPH oxidoreductase
LKVAIVGGTGPFGRALATRLLAAGDDIVLGSRDRARADEAAAEVGVEGAVNEAAVRGADLVVLATSASAMLDTARSLSLETAVLSVASELRSDEPQSLAERLADVVDVPVLAGLHSLAAGKLGAEPPDEDAFVCGDDADAKQLALDLAQKLVRGRAVDAGPLRSARALEALTGVIVGINRRYKIHAGLRVTGFR